MGLPFAEVIGDPIAQSKSPLIHKQWLRQLGMDGEYLKSRVPAGGLEAFLARRSADPDWRGCNLTIPHKERVAALLDRLAFEAEAIGAVNCIVPDGDGLTGFNTDADGIAAALDPVRLDGCKAAVIGAGGAARALVAYLDRRRVREIVLLVRDPGKAESLRPLAGRSRFEILPLARSDAGFEGAAAIVNASPLGMAGAADMPAQLLNWLERHSKAATLFDMVTTPAETPFLQAGGAAGAKTVDGLTMLIGQAARAFELFFGRPAPAADAKLRDLLTT